MHFLDWCKRLSIGRRRLDYSRRCAESTEVSLRRAGMSFSAMAVKFNAESFTVQLQDGRELRVPLFWFPVLEAATPTQRTKVRISTSGEGLHWDELDEASALQRF
jgi:hypothetical protein